MVYKVLFISLCILAAAFAQSATSHISVSHSNGGEYSYRIAHDPPGGVRGSSRPHGYGGFGDVLPYQRQNQNRLISPDPNFQIPSNTERNSHAYQNVNIENRQSYPVGTLLHRQHADRGFQTNFGDVNQQNYERDQNRRYPNENSGNGYRGYLLGNEPQNQQVPQPTSYINSNLNSLSHHRRIY